MTKIRWSLVGILLVLTAVNAGWKVYTTYNTFHEYFTAEDSTSHADRVFEPARKALEGKNIVRLGYRIEPEADFGTRAGEFYTIQYALAPIMLRPYTTEDYWVLVNTSHKGFAPPDLTCIEDLGSNLALYQKRVGKTPAFDLGRIWEEKEGEWSAVWTRRADSNTFDGRWISADGQVVTDEVVFESVNCHEVVLYRKEINGRYRGRLSDDETRIENGGADWFGPDHRWSAKVIR